MSVHNTIMDNITAALDVLKTSDNYDLNPKKVMAYAANYQTLTLDKTPAIMILDQGNDAIVAEDSANVRFAFDVLLWVYVRGNDWADIQEKLNDGLSSLSKLS